MGLSEVKATLEVILMDIGFTHFGFGLGRGGTLDGGTSRAEL